MPLDGDGIGEGEKLDELLQKHVTMDESGFKLTVKNKPANGFQLRGALSNQ
jgi:hypothetical protein